MHFPHREWSAERNRKLSPNHDRLVADGGQMGAYNGWERANWFLPPEARAKGERVVGIHFFNPAPVMLLVEVIPGSQTDPGVASTAR